MSHFPPIPFTTRADNISAHMQALNVETVNRAGLRVWVLLHQRILDGHGTRAKYNSGCGCSWCQESERRYNRRPNNSSERKRRSRAARAKS